MVVVSMWDELKYDEHKEGISDVFSKRLNGWINGLIRPKSINVIDAELNELKKNRDELGKKVKELEEGLPEGEDSDIEGQNFEPSESALVYHLKRQVTALKYSNACLKVIIKEREREIELNKAAMKYTKTVNTLGNFLHVDTIKSQRAKIEKYTQGPKKRSSERKKKWELARKYFIEEIPNHKTLKEARQAAAIRVGIRAEERHLIKMLPDPR
jgi:hypothetical protein